MMWHPKGVNILQDQQDPNSNVTMDEDNYLSQYLMLSHKNLSYNL